MDEPLALPSGIPLDNVKTTSVQALSYMDLMWLLNAENYTDIECGYANHKMTLASLEYCRRDANAQPTTTAYPCSTGMVDEVTP